MLRRGLTFSMLVYAASCQPSKPKLQEGATAPTVITVPTTTATATATAPPPARSLKDEVVELAFVPGGALVAYGSHAVVAWSPDGTVRRHAVDRSVRIHAASDHRGVALEDDDEKAGSTTLLATPSLAPLYDGPGKVTDYGTAIWVEAKREVLVALEGDRLGRIPLPQAAAPDSRPWVDTALDGSRINVTWIDSSGVGHHALLWDVAKGSALPRGIANPRGLADGRSAVIAGIYGYEIGDRTLSRVDLRSGAVTKTSIACPAKNMLSNPTPSSSHDIVLVTCETDGIVLDGKSLRERRRIPAIMPGCDNGMTLDGQIAGDQHTLRVEGCGGEARLDLATGVYACSDDPGLAGAPYDVGIPGPGTRSAPHGRGHLKPCTPRNGDYGRAVPLGTSRRYQLIQGEEHWLVKGPASEIALDGETSMPVLSADEQLIAFARGTTVVVRQLPSGTVKAELDLFEP